MEEVVATTRAKKLSSGVVKNRAKRVADRPRTPSYEELKTEFKRKLPRKRLLAIARTNKLGIEGHA